MEKGSYVGRIGTLVLLLGLNVAGHRGHTLGRARSGSRLLGFLLGLALPLKITALLRSVPTSIVASVRIYSSATLALTFVVMTASLRKVIGGV